MQLRMLAVFNLVSSFQLFTKDLPRKPLQWVIKKNLGTILEYEKDLPDIAGNLLEQSFEYTI